MCQTLNAVCTLNENPKFFGTVLKFFGTLLEICGNHAEAQIMPTPDLACTKYLIHDLSIEILPLLMNRCCTLLFFSPQILFEARLKRPRPHLDDKILTSWNALMISGLCHAGAARDRRVRRGFH